MLNPKVEIMDEYFENHDPRGEFCKIESLNSILILFGNCLILRIGKP